MADDTMRDTDAKKVGVTFIRKQDTGKSPMINIAIPEQLLFVLISDKHLKPCEIKCLNRQSAACLRRLCMQCCAKTLCGNHTDTNPAPSIASVGQITSEDLSSS